jgi:hypothetical protein
MPGYVILIPGIVHRDGMFSPDVRVGEHDGHRLRWRRLTAPERFNLPETALMHAALAADRTAKRHPDRQITVRS